MPTERKSEAARANGPGKDQAGFDALRDAFLAELRPEGEIELDLVDRMVTAKWRQSCSWRLETALIKTEIARQREDVEENWTNPNDEIRLALAFESLASWKGPLQHLNRYEARLRRQYERAFQQLSRLRADRRPPAAPSAPPQQPAAQPPALSPSESGAPAVNGPNSQPDRVYLPRQAAPRGWERGV